MRINKILCITLILIILCIPLKKTYADNEVLNAEATDDGNTTPNDPTNPSSGDGSGSGPRIGVNSGCSISISTTKKYTLNFDIYDTNGNLLGNPFSSSFEQSKFTAGRFVGIDAYEKTEIIKTATGTPYCEVTEKVCIYVPYWYCENSNPYIEAENYEEGNKDNKISKLAFIPIPRRNCYWIGRNHTTTTTGTCPAFDNDSVLSSSTSYETRACDASEASGSCTKEAVLAALNAAIIGEVDAAEHYDASRYDTNDINAKHSNGRTQTYPIQSYKISHVDSDSEAIEIPTNQTGSYAFQKKAWLKVKYNLQQACINGRTGEISYYDYARDANNNINYDVAKDRCIAAGGLPVERIYNSEGDPVGQYFIPLNSKSISEFNYVLSSKNMETNGKLCQQIIDNYPDGRWKQLLLDSSKQSLSDATSVDLAKIRVADGCYYAISVNFKDKIVQSFYGTEKNANNSISLVSYQPFYRPIDPNNPFPNGLDTDSMWYNLYNPETNEVTVTNKSGTTKTANLSDSFATMTYRASALSSSKVSQLNDTIYTSWRAINSNGTSNNIGNGIIERMNVDISTQYNLGCGPSNSNWEGCGNK